MKRKNCREGDWRTKHMLRQRYGEAISSNERFEDNQEKDLIKDYLWHREKRYINENNACMISGESSRKNLTNQNEYKLECFCNSNECGEQKDAAKSKWNLNDMAKEILKAVALIRHDGNLYRYTGKSYKIIKNGEELLEVVRSDVSYDAFGSTSIGRFNDLLVFLKADNRLFLKDYEEKVRDSQYYIAFRNGVLDVRTLQLKPHSKKYLVFYELDMEWKTNAYPKKFLQFLGQISNNDEAIAKRMMEVLGYLLSTVNDGKYFFVMGVAPDSGKSTMAELLQKIIGNEYIAHISTYQIGNRFALGDIHGKTLNFAMDLPKGKLNPVVVSIIKQITGGDVITTDQKYERMREVHSNMRFLFASNYPVAVPKEEDDDSFWNRMVIVPFQYSIEKEAQDRCLADKLFKEREDIVSLCLHAFHQVLNRGCVFSECKIAEELKEKWRQGENDLYYTLQEFFADCIQVTGNKQDSLYAMELYNLYVEYCKQREWYSMKYNQVMEWCEKNISECEKKRIHHTGTNPKAGFVGMKLLSTCE